MEPTFTIPQLVALKIFPFSEPTLRKLIKNKQIDAYKLGSKKKPIYYTTISAVEKYLNAHSMQS